MRDIGAWGNNHSPNYGGEHRDGEKSELIQKCLGINTKGENLWDMCDKRQKRQERLQRAYILGN